MGNDLNGPVNEYRNGWYDTEDTISGQYERDYFEKDWGVSASALTSVTVIQGSADYGPVNGEVPQDIYPDVEPGTGGSFRLQLGLDYRFQKFQRVSLLLRSGPLYNHSQYFHQPGYSGERVGAFLEVGLNNTEAVTSPQGGIVREHKGIGGKMGLIYQNILTGDLAGRNLFGLTFGLSYTVAPSEISLMVTALNGSLDSTGSIGMVEMGLGLGYAPNTLWF